MHVVHAYCTIKQIGGCDGGHGHGMVLEAKGVGEMLTACPFHDGADAAVVFQQWTDVPTVGTG